MFVTSRTHEKLRDQLNETLQELIDSRLQTQEANNCTFAVVKKFNELQARWNDVIERINEKGGEAFLNHGQIYGYSTAVEKQFTNDELKSLLRLVHPDKHGGRDTATKMFQKINELL